MQKDIRAGFCLIVVILLLGAVFFMGKTSAATITFQELVGVLQEVTEFSQEPEDAKQEDGEEKEDGEKKNAEKEDAEKKDAEKEDGEKKDAEKEEGESKEEAPKEETPETVPAEPPKSESEEKKPETPEAAPAEPPKSETAAPAAETPSAEAPKSETAPPAAPAEPPKPAAPEKSEKKYETLTLKSSPLSINTELDATLWTPEYEILQAKTKVWESLKVKTVLPHGHFVKKGELLISFEREDYEKELENARRNLEMSRLNFQKTKISNDLLKKYREMDEEDIKLSREQLEKEFKHVQKWDYDLVKRSYEDQMKAAQTALENEQEELRQLEKMYRDNDLREETEEIVLRRQRRVVEVAQLNLDRVTARHEWVMAETYPLFLRNYPRSYPRLVWQQDAETETRPLEQRISEILFRQAEVNLEQAEKRFQELEADGKSLAIHAPRDGYIYYGSFAEGTWENYARIKPQMLEGESVQANRPIMTIVGSSELVLHGNVAEKDFSKVLTGQKGFFVPNAFPEAEFPVKLTSLSEIPVAAGTFAAVLSVESGGELPKVYPGMRGKVTLASIRKSNALMVPETAVGRNDAMQRCVYILKDGTPQQRVVKIGRTADKKMEILDGLESGMEIVKTYTSVEQD